MFLHGTFAMLQKQEVERLREHTLAGRTEQVGLNCINFGVPAPDHTERLEEVAVDVVRGLERPSQFIDRRRRFVGDPRGSIL